VTVELLYGVSTVFPVPDVDSTASWFWDAYMHDPNGYVLVSAEQTTVAAP
jgi:hypothetical protein